MSLVLAEAAPDGAYCAVRFMLDADVAPGLLQRLLQPFAKRDLVPDRMWSHRSRDMLHVEIAMDAMPGEFVHMVEGNLRQVIGVHSVTRVAERDMRRAA
jgi:hypothetical protein